LGGLLKWVMTIMLQFMIPVRSDREVNLNLHVQKLSVYYKFFLIAFLLSIGI